jgi:hypothetical protein
MKNKIIALLLILTSYKLSAKNDSTSVIKSGIGITLSPMLSMPIYKYSSLYYYNSNRIKYYPGFSFLAGASGNLVVSKKHKLYLGIDLGFLTNSGTQKNLPNATLVTIGPNGSVTYQTLNYYNITSRFNYLYLAASLQKVIVKVSKKMFLFAGIGAQFNYNYSIRSSTQNMVDYNGNNIDRVYHESGAGIGQYWSVSAFAKVGLMANLTQHLSFFAAPVFYYDLNPNVLFKKNYAQFNSGGINLQLIYAF